MDETNPISTAENGQNPERKLKIYKIIKTGFLQQIWICLGMWASSINPCIDVLRKPIHCNYEQIARALAAKSIGIIAGSIGGGIIADKLQRWVDIQLAISVGIAGISIACIPWSPNLPVMATAFFINGVGQGSISASGNSHSLAMWGKDANAPFHFIHAGYGIGTILGPIVVAPFLPSVKNDTIHNKTVDYEDNISQTSITHLLTSVENTVSYPMLQLKNSSHFSNITNSSSYNIDVKLPFGATGGYSCLISFIFFIFAFFPLHKYLKQQESQQTTISDQRKSFKEILSIGSCAGGDTVYAIQMFSMIFLFYVLLVGKDASVATFLQPIAVNTPSLNFSLKEADVLITVFFVCLTSGRLIVSAIGKWIPVQVLIFVESIGLLAALLCLVLFGLESKLNFWLTTCSFALCTGPIYPSGMAWSDRYIKMTAMAFAILDIGIGCGSFLFNWLGGYLLNRNKKNPVILFYVGLGCAITTLLLLIVMQIRGSLHGDRYKKIEQNALLINENAEQLENDRSPLIQ